MDWRLTILILILVGVSFIIWKWMNLKKFIIDLFLKNEKKDWESKGRHLKRCEEDIKRALSELNIYKFAEQVIGCGGWEWDMTKDPDEVRYTDQFAKIFDVVAGGVITAKQLMDIVHVDDRDRVNKVIKEHFEKGESYIVEYRVVRRNDRHDLVKCWGYPQLNINDKTTGIKGAVLVIQTDVD